MSTATDQAHERKADTQELAFKFDLHEKGESVDLEARTFEGLANTWDLDRVGDVVHRGAFRRTIKHWKESGRVLYLLDNHSAYGSVLSVLGKLLEAKETKAGLWVKYEVAPGATGDQLLAMLKGGFLDSLSIGYRPVKFERPTDAERRAGIGLHLKEVEWRETSVVIFPANEGARIKADDDSGTEASEASDDPAGSGDSPEGLAPGSPERLKHAATLRSLKLGRLGLTAATRPSTETTED